MPKQKWRLFGIFLLFFALPWLFFGLGVNVIKVPLAPGDGAVYGYPALMNSKNSDLWNPYVQSGTFQAKNIEAQFLYLPTKIILSIFPNPFGYNLLLLLHYSLGGFFTYLFLKEIRAKDFSAIFSGIVFMFCGFMVGHKGHHSIVMTAAYLPIVIYLFERFYQTRKKSALIFTGIALGFSFFADYTAVTMYICMTTGFFVIYSSFFREKQETLQRRVTLFCQSLLGIFGVAILIAMVQLIPVAESFPYLTREKITFEFFTSYSFGFRDLPLILFPYIFGSHSPGFYSAFYFSHWNLTELIGYIGILPLFLILLGAKSRLHHQQFYFWLISAIFFFLLVLGSSTPLYKLMYKIPIYNLFRASARNWLEVDFCVAVLSGLVLDQLFLEFEKVRVTDFITSASIIFVFIIFVMFFILNFVGQFIDDPNLLNNWNNNIKFPSTAVLVPIVLTILTYIVIILIPFSCKSNILKYSILLLIFIDLFSFGHFHDTGYVTEDAINLEKNEVFQFFKSTDSSFEKYRIYPTDFDTSLDSIYPERNLLFGMNVINDYGPLWLKDYVALTGFYANGFSFRQNQLISDNKLLSALSTKYLVASDPGTKKLLNQFIQRQGGATTLDGNNWTVLNATKENLGKYQISSTNPESVSMIYKEVLLSPYERYDINLDIKPLMHPSEKYYVYVDFFDQGNSKDVDGCDYTIELDGNAEMQTINFSFRPGDIPSSYYVLRVFTFSGNPTIVSNIRAVSNLSPQTDINKTINYVKLFETQSGTSVYQNLMFLPRARFISTGVPVKNIEEIVDLIMNTNFDLSAKALVTDLAAETDYAKGTILSADYSDPTRLEFLISTKGPSSFLLLSDSWYPGWQASSDGKKLSILKTNGVSMGIVIPDEGVHNVTFAFVPFSFYLGASISGLTLCILLISVFVPIKRQKFHKS